MVSPDVLLGPRLKTDRADQHIRELLSLTQPLSPDFFELQVESGTRPPEMKPHTFHLRYHPLKPIPETLALVIGNAVHNLRSALDHFASGVIRTNDPGAKPYFSVPKNRHNLEQSGDLAQMERALPGSKKLLFDKIRPVNSATDYLWSFGSLDIDDKHNLVVPTVTVANIAGVSADIGRSRLLDNTSRFNAAKPFTLVTASHPFTLKGEPKATVDVTFGKGTPFDGEAIIPTLLDIRNLVAETLDAFELLIDGKIVP